MSWLFAVRPQFPKLTIFGRSLLLIGAEVLANVVIWTFTGIIFGTTKETKSILGLALLAWTLGLRHALDADHISAIDNATRGLIGMGQMPVTCGLYFSLGHSTIVIVVNIAIAISTSVYEKIDGVGTIGGIVGSAVSGSFLFIVGVANSIILWRILSRRREIIKSQSTGNVPPEVDSKHSQFLMMRILGPVIHFVDRPWKMYPVGVLFGFGFDTASSIALLAVSALAKKSADGSPIPSSHVVLLPFLFTAGMTMVDSLDSVLMLYSYSGFLERSFVIFKPQNILATSQPTSVSLNELETSNTGVINSYIAKPAEPEAEEPGTSVQVLPIASDNGDQSEMMRLKMNTMSGLSIVLTLLSILVAFSISIITIMGLIGDNCKKCTAAAEAEDGGGLAGRWWRGWAKANDNSGYIGAAIVGSFALIVCGWYGGRWLAKRYRKETRTGGVSL